MSLQAIRILTRSLSANLYRHAASIAKSQYSSVSSASRRPIPNTPKNTEIEEEPVLPPRSAVKRKPAPKIKAIQKGDTYTAGEAYYSFDPYTFYDVEEKLHARRQPQISSSEKAL